MVSYMIFYCEHKAIYEIKKKITSQGVKSKPEIIILIF